MRLSHEAAADQPDADALHVRSSFGERNKRFIKLDAGMFIPFLPCSVKRQVPRRQSRIRMIPVLEENRMTLMDEQARETPRDFETLRALIVERRETLPKRLAQVAVYALDSPDEIAFGTAASVAQAADVQPSTL